MRQWPKIALGDVLCRSSEPAVCVPDAEYDEVTIRLWGKGVISRGKVRGADVTTPRRVVRANQLILSKIDARNGAIGLVPHELDGAIVSNDFPSFEFAESRQLDPAFMGWMVRSRHFVDLCKAASEGTTNRVRIKEDRFLAQQIVLPPLAEQQAIVSRLDTLADKVRQVNERLDAIERDADRLLAVRFRDAIAGAPVRPMAEVAPLVRREIAIDLEGIYPELGIRSFGKGTFHKPPLTGADVGTKRLFSIEPGDLLFSNVFAWEGAIAVAQPEDAGRCGSHRFITCRVNPEITSPEFLRYYFLTDAGLEKIGEASPGGAGRNRTLGLEKLMAIEVPIPPLARQRTFDALQAKVAALKARHTTIRQANDALIPAMLERVFSEAH
ncbi:type I restriction-modification enzyme, specificity subunit [Alcanivorax sp. S71-1-4]|uniref:restriction endonuclease subunit S n=1 Tax=Alcanivorax sp. S71-1-4 TaxID=1177159 RepID=UPI00135C171A|nr:restriction endonuclease subunit S [Alcanivorax sp. S71-1-4]KAF0810072.1 type I restriction-modification enzyme, specificity subunit [Alcanivorax sp. S71-1-4]